MANDAKPGERKPAKTGDPDRDNAHLFEEFKRPAQPGEAPKPKGLNAQGYQFPPQVGQPAMTKENIAKGLGLPPSGNIVPPLPPSTELVAADPLFEEYQRPDLKDKPRTGQGLRTPPPLPPTPPGPKTAKEILANYEPPTPKVLSGKRDNAPAPIAIPQAPPPIINPARSLAASQAPHGSDAASDAAHLDAEADLASAPELTMSHSRSHGPMKTVTEEDPFAEMPTLDTPRRAPAPALSAPPPSARGTRAPEPMPAPTAAPIPSMPHVNDAPAVTPGDGPRIAVVQADFNYAITTRMAQVATKTAQHLGCQVAMHVHVGGVFDVPLVAKALAARGDVDAVVAIGCVIQGETGHDQLIATECARKLADLSYDSGKPVGLAVTGPRMSRAAAESRAESVPKHAVEAVVKQWRALKAIGASRLAAR